MISIGEVSLLDILPDSLKRDPQVRAMAEAITPELQDITQAIQECLLLPRLDSLPEEVVDLLAWQLHVDFYEPDLPLEQKRQLVKESGLWHRRKGTPWAVEQVVSIIFPGAKVAEWWEYGGDPYHFRVETDQPLTAETDLHRLVRMIDATKNLRSWLENVTIKRTLNSGLYYGGVQSEFKRTTIYPIAIQMPNLTMQQSVGGIVSETRKTMIH